MNYWSHGWLQCYILHGSNAHCLMPLYRLYWLKFPPFHSRSINEKYSQYISNSARGHKWTFNLPTWRYDFRHSPSYFLNFQPQPFLPNQPNLRKRHLHRVDQHGSRQGWGTGHLLYCSDGYSYAFPSRFKLYFMFFDRNPTWCACAFNPCDFRCLRVFIRRLPCFCLRPWVVRSYGHASSCLSSSFDAISSFCRTNGITPETEAASKKGDVYKNQIKGFFIGANSPRPTARSMWEMHLGVPQSVPTQRLNLASS